jgi:hypothetical protein
MLRPSIPPGGAVEFTHEPARPLPARSDGHFEPHAEIADVLVIHVPAAPARAATPSP